MTPHARRLALLGAILAVALMALPSGMLASGPEGPHGAAAPPAATKIEMGPRETLAAAPQPPDHPVTPSSSPATRTTADAPAKATDARRTFTSVPSTPATPPAPVNATPSVSISSPESAAADATSSTSSSLENAAENATLAPRAPSAPAASPPPSTPPGPSVPTPTWADVAHPSLAEARYPSMAYDADDGYMVLFGLSNAGCGCSTVTWTEQDGVWKNITGVQTSEPGVIASMSPPIGTLVYDSTDGYILLLDGGTWIFQGGSWTEAFPADAPPATLTGETLVNDPGDRDVLLYGGMWSDSGTGILTSATWTYKGGVWENITSMAGTPPSPRTEAGATYDPADSEVLLFGGDAGGPDLDGDTWTFYGETWHTGPSGGPSARAWAPLSYDAQDGYVLLEGGYGCDSGIVCTDTWDFSGGAWSEAFPTTSPDAGDGVVSTLAYDPTQDYTLFVDWETTSSSADVWSWPAPLTASSSTSSPAVDANQPLTFTATASGGAPDLSYSWSGLPAGCTDQFAASEPCTPTSSGWSNVTLIVTDASEREVTASTVELHVWSDPSPATPAPSAPTTDQGAQVSFTDKVTGGSGGYTYAWAGPTWMGCGGTTSSLLACRPTSSGVAQVQLTVTDSDGYAAASPQKTFIVNAPPSVTLQENRTVLDAFEPITFWANTTGGTAPYTISYSGLPAGCASANVSVLSCNPNATGTFTVHAWVNDSADVEASSSPVSFTVDSDPTAQIFFDQGSVDSYANATMDVELTVSGGTPSYLECDATASVDGTPCVTGGGTPVHFSLPYGAAGTYDAVFSVRDATGYNVTLPVTFDIFWTPSVTPESPPQAMEEGVAGLLPFSIDGGFLPATVWVNDTTAGVPIGKLLATTDHVGTLSYAPDWDGTHFLSYTIRDSYGSVENSTMALIVAAHLATYVSGVGLGLANTSLKFVVTGLDGVAPYTLCLERGTGGPWTCKGSVTGVLDINLTFPLAGVFTVTATAEDTLGVNESASMEATVLWPLGSPSVALSGNGTLDSGTSVAFTASFVHGYPGYWCWLNDTTAGLPLWSGFPKAAHPESCLGTFNVTWSSGTHELEFLVRDSLGESVVAWVNLTGAAAFSVTSVTLEAGGVTVSGLSDANLTVEVDGWVDFNATLAGGLPTYDSEVNSLTTSPFILGLCATTSPTCTSTLRAPVEGPGRYPIDITFKDQAGGDLVFPMEIWVVPAMSFGNFSLRAPNGTAPLAKLEFDAGIVYEYSVVVGNGSGPFIVSLTIGSAPPLNFTAPSRAFNGNLSQAALGQAALTLTVTDAYGVEVVVHAVLNVVAPVTMGSVSCPDFSISPSKGVYVTNESIKLTVPCVSGGVAPYTYWWNLEPFGWSPALTGAGANEGDYSFVAAGLKTIGVRVMDAGGSIAVAWTNLSIVWNVTAAPPSHTPQGPWYTTLTPLQLGVLALIPLLLAFVLVAYLVGRRRQKKRDGGGASASASGSDKPSGPSSPSDGAIQELQRQLSAHDWSSREALVGAVAQATGVDEEVVDMQLAILIGSGRVDVGGSKENPTYRLNAKDDSTEATTASAKASPSSHSGGHADDDAERQGRLQAALLAVVHTRPRASRADLDDAVKALGPSTADVNFALEALLRDGTLKVRSVPDADLDTPVYEAGPASQTGGKGAAGPKVETDEEGGVKAEGLRGILG